MNTTKDTTRKNNKKFRRRRNKKKNRKQKINNNKHHHHQLVGSEKSSPSCHHLLRISSLDPDCTNCQKNDNTITTAEHIGSSRAARLWNRMYHSMYTNLIQWQCNYQMDKWKNVAMEKDLENRDLKIRLEETQQKLQQQNNEKFLQFLEQSERHKNKRSQIRDEEN